MTDLPPPLVSHEIDLKGMSGFMVWTDRFMGSTLKAVATPEEIGAAFTLWVYAWRQHPHGSIPDDDATLAAWVYGPGKVGMTRWMKIKKNALRGFVLCSDFRLYHKVLCEEVLEIWKKRKKWRDNRQAYREKFKAATEEKQQLSEAGLKDTSSCPMDVLIERESVEGECRGRGREYISHPPKPPSLLLDEEAAAESAACEREKQKPAKPNREEYSADFEEAWQKYPKRSGGNSKAEAWKAWKARIAQGVVPGDLIAGVERYARYCDATEKTGKEFVKQAATFFGPGENWKEAWEIPRSQGQGGRFDGHKQSGRLDI